MPKSSQSNRVCKDYSRSKVGRFLRHSVHFASAVPHAKCNDDDDDDDKPECYYSWLQTKRRADEANRGT